LADGFKATSRRVHLPGKTGTLDRPRIAFWLSETSPAAGENAGTKLAKRGEGREAKIDWSLTNGLARRGEPPSTEAMP